jgi:hypothetical protein
MSGGFFDYQQYRLGYIADAVEQLIRDNHSKELNDWAILRVVDTQMKPFRNSSGLLNY